ncbi:NACHT domain-containing protein [Oceanobacter kriegii]|uniref:NACHT domain-containing protein n=1 Tax=Oceanobacter kriegii TaxID=64972 RepID=UPI0004149BD1|nr:NACHT domain-containing protein [Oceanobacter kriegii]
MDVVGAVTVEFLSSLLLKFSEKASDRVKRQLARFKEESKVEELKSKISNFTMVKTVWSVDKPIDLKEFYNPVRIRNQNRGDPVGRLESIDFDRGLIVIGVAGQGKSIFMRYLCSQEIRFSERIPVFIELRYLSEVRDLDALISSALSNLGFEVSDELVEYFLSEGFVVLFLDGYDEVSRDLQLDFIFRAEELRFKYKKLRVVISSRPGTSINRMAGYSVVDIQPLSSDDFESILQKITTRDMADQLIDGILHSDCEIEGLLTTPLMMTLLVLTYKSIGVLPRNHADFYENLFETLVVKHDRSKPGFVRARSYAGSDHEMRKVFEVFCFIAARKQLNFLPSSVALEMAADSIKRGAECLQDPRGFLDDMNKVASLLIYEGMEYSFVHKSVLDYFSACYVRNSIDDFAYRFYSSMANSHSSWGQQLGFLSGIDTYRYLKGFYIPYLKRILRFYGVRDFEKFNEDEVARVEDILKSHCFYYNQEGFETQMDQSESLFFTYDDTYNLISSKIERFRLVEKPGRKEYADEVFDRVGPYTYKCDLFDLLVLHGVDFSHMEHLKNVEDVFERYREKVAYINLVDSNVDLLDF